MEVRMEVAKDLLMEQEKQPEHDFSQIRRSIVVVAMKLLVLLILFEALYITLFYFLKVFFNLPLEWHHHSSIILLGINVVKIILEFSFILYLFFQWAGTSYFIAKKHIIKRVGIMSSREEVFHFDNIRSLTVSQSFLGKIFNYGDIEVKTSASGGYQATLVLVSINDPHKYEAHLKTLF